MKYHPLPLFKSHADERYSLKSRLTPTLLAVAALSGLAACGGGGGGGGTGNTETGQSSGGSTPAQPTALEDLPTSTLAFRFQTDGSITDLSGWSQSLGNGMLAGWNPRHGATVLSPGLKIGFFGHANGCAEGASDGPSVAATSEQAASLTTAMGLSVDDATSSSWIPSGVSTSCDADTQSRQGPSAVYYNPAASNGGFGLYTPIGPETNGDTPFIGAYDSKGIDNAGTNANGLSTFVGFRMPWSSANAVKPWVSSTGTSGTARIVSTQFVGSMQAPTAGSSVIQVKQQIVVALINKGCQQAGSSVTGPCQMQYLFNTAVARAGVSDWNSFAPPSEGRVWFDSAQSSMPIIAGQVPEAGVEVKDQDSGLSLYSSAGYATQHQTFTSKDFDLRVTPVQLQNAVKLVAAKRLGVSVDSLSETQIASVWGSKWSDMSSWALVTSMIGQESYNEAFASKLAWIGGGFSRLYVGPAL